MIRPVFNKKSQFGPDVLIGFLLIAVLGLGGVFFLNAFVNGLSLTGLLKIMDAETEQKCFFMLLPLSGDDYIRSGVPYSSIKSEQFRNLKDFFGTRSPYEDVSKEFNDTISEIRAGIDPKYNDPELFPAKITYIDGFMASNSKANELIGRVKGATSVPCSMVVYGPYTLGVAELFISTAGETK